MGDLVIGNEDYYRGYKQGRADAIEEYRLALHKKYADNKYLYESNMEYWNLDMEEVDEIAVQLKQNEHIANADKMIETETWNSMHGKVVMPKGTFDRLYELAKQNKEQDDV